MLKSGTHAGQLIAIKVPHPGMSPIIDLISRILSEQCISYTLDAL
ncbi:hypothetical protein [Candidatus Vallotiella sp. (ex Adelges kitamiensis)]|nr:hypothetical protein [Candidatus Vallotia sp. (ex Adelges kitamiensis)]